MRAGSSARANGAPARAPAALALAAALGALAYDPAAEASQCKRVVGLAAGVAALAIAVASLARERSRALSLGAASLAWLAFVGWSSASLAWGAPAGLGKVGAWCAASALLASASLAPPEDARATARLAAASVGAVSSAAAIAQYATGARGLAVHGGAGNPNWLGLVLAAALPLTLEEALAKRRPGPAHLVVVAEIAALALSHARVAWGATALAVALWPLLARGRLAPRLAALALVAGAVAAGSAWLAREQRAPAALDVPAEAVGAVDVPAREAWDGRVWIWRASGGAALRALPAGGGLGSFARGFLEEQGRRLAPLPPREASRRFVNATTAHEDWLEAAVEGGAPAIALLAAAIGAAIASALRARWIGGALALVALASTAFGDSPLEQPGVVLLLALVLAGLPRRVPLPRRTSLGLLAALLVASALLLAPATASWLGTRRATEADTIASPAARLARLASAARLDPRSGEIALSVGLARLEQGDAAGALTDLRRARALLADVAVPIAIGNAELTLGDAARAEAAYAEALALDPGSFRARADRALALAALGRLDEADAELSVARSLWPGHPRLAAVAEAIRKARIERETAP